MGLHVETRAKSQNGTWSIAGAQSELVLIAEESNWDAVRWKAVLPSC